MIRQLLAFAVVFGMSSSSLSAQNVRPPMAELTVSAASANVHKYPSVGSPVIGNVQSGTVLTITRNLGSWVEVPWPGSEVGIAFVHVNSGSISRRSIPQQYPDAAAAPAMSETVRPAGTTLSAEQHVAANRSLQSNRTYISLPNHTVGVGGRMSPSGSDLGATARTWWNRRVGLQFEFSRSVLDGIDTPERFTFMRFTPTMVFSIVDHVSDSWWVRPYAGGGVNFHRAALRQSAVISMDRMTHNGAGFHGIGGVESTFAGLPQFTLSAEVAYRPWETSFAKVAQRKVSISLSGHWYIR